jgi:hypothetical protein
LNELQNELPTLAELETFVRTVDEHLLRSISQNNTNRILHQQWVKTNAKFAKILLVTSKRSAKKQLSRKLKPQKAKVKALTKPPTKRIPPVVELEDNLKATAKRAMARKTSGIATASETKDCFRPEAMVDGKKVWGCQGVVDEMLNGNNSHELKALLARSVSPPVFEDSSEGASSPNADSGGGASSVSDMAPPSRTQAAPDDPDFVEEVGFAYKCKGAEVIEAVGEVVCMICHLPIKADDLVVVNVAEEIRHDSCLNIADAVKLAGKAAPLKPYKAKEIKQERKAKRAATAAAGKKAPLPGVSDDAALKRHNELMFLAKPMAKTGESNGDTWRVRYEPTKRVSWLNTRHAVVLRWGSGTCKTHQFEFSEMAMGDDAFCLSFDKAVSDVVKSATE